MRLSAPVAILLLTILPTLAAAQDVPRDEPSFTEFVANALRKEVGNDVVVVKGRLTLGLGEIQANLDRIYRFCGADASACPAEVDRYVKGAAQVHRDRNAPPTRESVRIVIRSSKYVQAAAAAAVDKSQALALMPRPFLEGMVTLPVLDSPRTLKMLGPKDASALGLSEQEAYELGLANLRKDLKPVMEVAKVAGKGQIGQLVGDTFHPSRMLLTDTWAPLAQAQGGVLVAAMPANDVVLYISEDTPVALDALRALVNRVLSRAPNPLSGALLRWSDSGWQLVPP